VILKTRRRLPPRLDDTAVKRAVRGIRPDPITPFEVRFETPPGEQAQVDLAKVVRVIGGDPSQAREIGLGDVKTGG
jgi:transposase